MKVLEVKGFWKVYFGVSLLLLWKKRNMIDLIFGVVGEKFFFL